MSVKRITAFIICLLIIGCVFLSCEPMSKASGLGNGTEPVGSMELKFATGFSVDYYQDGCRLITIQDEERFLIVPENVPVPSGISKDIVVLKQPIKNVYIAATAVMCLIDG
ncbi:MAG: ABC transporter substrate-binding protein, partial [Clostridia bacterium]|nr:ABC transporter substrate-binding protein [Clostridia bacterium]